MLDKIRGAFPDEEFIMLDGLSEAVVGFRIFFGECNLEYSFEGIIDTLEKRDGMTQEEAVEFFYFNIEPLKAMKNGPLFLENYDTEDLE